MKEILEKLKSIIVVLEKEHGPIQIFALFLREDPLEKWDVVVSALWLNPDDIEAYRIVTSRIQQSLSASELLQFSRVVLLDQKDPVVAFLQDLETIQNGGYSDKPPAELLSEKFGFTIKRAYLLRSQKSS